MRGRLHTALDASTNVSCTVTSLLTVMPDSISTYEEKYREEVERKESAAKYISFEERTKRYSRRTRNRRGKESKKIHQNKRKIWKLENKMEKKRKEIKELQIKKRGKSLPLYDIPSESSDEDDWLIL